MEKATLPHDQVVVLFLFRTRRCKLIQVKSRQAALKIVGRPSSLRGNFAGLGARLWSVATAGGDSNWPACRRSAARKPRPATVSGASFATRNAGCKHAVDGMISNDSAYTPVKVARRVERGIVRLCVTKQFPWKRRDFVSAPIPSPPIERGQRERAPLRSSAPAIPATKIEQSVIEPHVHAGEQQDQQSDRNWEAAVLVHRVEYPIAGSEVPETPHA